MKSIVHHEFSKDMGQFEDESLTSHCQNAGIVLETEFQSSFRHSKITFFKKFQTKKSWDIILVFISKNLFEVSSLPK